MPDFDMRRGFTLLEAMIVVLIIALLVASAVPNFISARASSRRTVCVDNLRILDNAKEQWAMENRAKTGASVSMSDLTAGGYLRGPVSGPQCQAGGTYNLRTIGETPVCSRADSDGHKLD